MKVIKRAIVKQVLTETSKAEFLKVFTEEKNRYVTECEQLDFERRKALKNQDKKNHSSIAARFNEEIGRRKEKIRSIDFQIEQLKILPLGTEVVEKEIETISELKVGDNWKQSSQPAEIVVKDGVILEIRP